MNPSLKNLNSMHSYSLNNTKYQLSASTAMYSYPSTVRPDFVLSSPIHSIWRGKKKLLKENRELCFHIFTTSKCICSTSCLPVRRSSVAREEVSSRMGVWAPLKSSVFALLKRYVCTLFAPSFCAHVLNLAFLTFVFTQLLHTHIFSSAL